MNKPGLAVLPLLVLAGCGYSEGALRAVITLSSQQATCVVLTARDGTGAALDERRLPRTAGEDELVVAIYQGDFPDEITLTAAPHYGAGCEEPLLPNGAVQQETATFPRGEVLEVVLALAAPDATEDADRDGFTGADHGGADCDDADAAAYPGAAEACTTALDLNCNQAVGCADPVCEGQTCAVPPAALVFTSAEQTTEAGECSGELAVEARDAQGAPQTVTAALPLALSSPSADLGFFSDASCTTATEVAAIASGASSARFFVRGTVAGDKTIRVTASGLPAAEQDASIVAAEAATLEFATASPTVEAGACSGALVVRTRDAFGNQATVDAPVALALSATPPAGVIFYSDADCVTVGTQATISTGAAAASFAFRATVAGSITLLADGDAAGVGEATLPATVAPGEPTELIFTTGAHTVEAATCSPILTVTTRDALGNTAPVSAATVLTLSHDGGAGFQLFSDSGCATSVTQLSLASGSSSASFYFRGAAVDPSVTITVSGGGLSSAVQAQAVEAGAASRIRITSAPRTMAADAPCSGPVTIEVQDSAGNPVPAPETIQVSLAATPASGFTFYAGASCANGGVGQFNISNGATTGTFSFRGTEAGEVEVIVSTTAYGNDLQLETIEPGAPDTLVITSAPLSLTAGVCSASAITFQTEDGLGNASPVGGFTSVNLTANPDSGPNFTFHSTSGCGSGTEISSINVAPGTSAASFYVRGTSATSVDVQVARSGYAADAQTQTVSPAAASALEFLTSPQTVSPATCSAPHTLRVMDDYGNTVPGVRSITLTASPSAGFNLYAGAGCNNPATTAVSTAANGTAVFSFRGASTGTVNIAASSSPLQGVDQDQTIAPPLIRRGSCDIANGLATATCAISPALTNTAQALLFYQATSGASTAADSAVTCQITSTTSLRCDRVGVAGVVEVEYQAAQLGTDVFVQRSGDLPCTGGATSVNWSPPTAVDDASSFILVNGRRAGNDNAEGVFTSATLSSSGDQITISNPGGCGSGGSQAVAYEVQVVEFTGASVERGTVVIDGSEDSGDGPGELSKQVGSLSPADLSRTFLLYSVSSNVSQAITAEMCERMVRGRLDSTTSITFSRGDGQTLANCGGADLTVSWERIELPTGNLVWEYQVDTGTASTTTVPITQVDINRAVAITGAHGSTGQGGGEGSYAANDLPGEMRALLTFGDSTSLSATRGVTTPTGSAVFGAYVIQFAP